METRSQRCKIFTKSKVIQKGTVAYNTVQLVEVVSLLGLIVWSQRVGLIKPFPLSGQRTACLIWVYACR